MIAPGADGTAPRTAIVVEDGGRVEVVDGDVAYRSAPAWSPDGRSLAYVGDAELLVVHDGSHPQRLFTCAPPRCLGLGAPSWSPDGRTVAFAMLTERGDGLALLDVDARKPDVLAGVSLEGPPAWAPDGSAFAVPSGDRIDLVDAGGGSTVGSIPFPGRLGNGVSWSPDGDALAVEGTSDGTTGIWLVPAEGGTPTLLTSCGEKGCTDIGPAWSPDGRRLVFTRAQCDVPGGDCFTGDLFTIDAGGGSPEPLVVGSPLDCCAAWQPIVE